MESSDEVKQEAALRKTAMAEFLEASAAEAERIAAGERKRASELREEAEALCPPTADQ